VAHARSVRTAGHRSTAVTAKTTDKFLNAFHFFITRSPPLVDFASSFPGSGSRPGHGPPSLPACLRLRRQKRPRGVSPRGLLKIEKPWAVSDPPMALFAAFYPVPMSSSMGRPVHCCWSTTSPVRFCMRVLPSISYPFEKCDHENMVQPACQESSLKHTGGGAIPLKNLSAATEICVRLYPLTAALCLWHVRRHDLKRNEADR
jgi:hypothetical protein